MILTQAQKNRLCELAFAEVPNKDIAAQMGLPLTEIHAARHRMGITRDKVAAAIATAKKPFVNPEFEAAMQQMTVKPEFETAAAEMDKAVALQPKSCRTCVHWACFARGTDCTMTSCSHHITLEDRRKSFLFDRKRDFVCGISREDIGALPAEQVQAIKAFLDRYIPDDWRDGNG